MVRDFLKLLSYFNWITPLEVLSYRVFDGPGYSFKVPERAGLSGAKIVKMLRQQGGIQTYGHMVFNGHIMFHVRREQATFTQYLLKRAGIPIMNPVPSETGNSTPRPQPVRQGEGVLDKLNTAMNKFWQDIGL